MKTIGYKFDFKSQTVVLMTGRKLDKTEIKAQKQVVCERNNFNSSETKVIAVKEI